MSKPVTTSSARKRDRLLGLLILFSAFAGGMAVSLWAKDVSTPKPAPDPHPPTVEELPGFPKELRPFSVLGRARSLSHRKQFRGFVAEGVKSDGTMDFTKKRTKLRFSFQSEKGKGVQPPREGGTLPDRTYCGKQSVRVAQHGIGAMPDEADVGCPRREVVDMQMPKACSLEDVWKVAKDRRIKTNRSAKIEFYLSKRGPAYRFVQKQKKGGPKRFVLLAEDCKTLLKSKGQRGSVP